jgi:hypothetical protein
MQCGGRTVRDSAPEAAARASPHDRLADRLAAARRMQEQQLHAVAAANAASIPAAEVSKAAATESDSAAAAAARGDDTADVCVSVKVLTKPQPTVSALLLKAPLVAVCLSRDVRITACSCRSLPPSPTCASSCMSSTASGLGRA